MTTNYHNTNANSWKAKRRGPSGGGGYRGGNRGGSSYGGGNSYGGGRSQTTMHRANCAECNQSCEVPFRPNGRKPVYCSNCFRKDDHQAASSRFNDRGRNDRSESRGASNSGLEKEIKSLNKKMDRIIRALEALSEGEDYVDEEEAELLGDNIPGKMEDQINEDEGDVFTLE